MHVIARLCIDKVWRCEAPECGWASPPGAHRKTAYHHLDSAHPDMKPHTLSKRDVGQGVLSEEERAARRREQRRRSEAKRRAERRSKRGAGPRVRIDEAGGGTARRPLPHNYVFYLSAEASPDPIIVKMTEGRPGGQRVVLGGLAACAEESVHAGITWAAANIQRLGPWLLPRQRVQDLLPCVVGPGMDLSVCFPALAARKRGSSASAAVAAAVLWYSLAASGLKLRPECGMTGEVDLAGRVIEVQQLPDKLARAMEAGLSLVLAPAAQAQRLLRDANESTGVFTPGGNGPDAEAEAGLEELRRYVLRALRPVSTMEDAMRIIVHGGDALGPVPHSLPPSSSEEPRFGECRCFLQLTTSGACIRAQCCSIPFGSGQAWLTGCADRPAKESIDLAKRWLCEYWSDIAEQLGLDGDDTAMLDAALYSKTRDLHVHLSPLVMAKSSYVGGAVAVALVSMVTGRPVKPGLAVLGEMSVLGPLRQAVPASITRETLRWCQSCGISRVVVEGTSWARALAPGLTEEEVASVLEVIKLGTRGLQARIGDVLD